MTRAVCVISPEAKESFVLNEQFYFGTRKTDDGKHAATTAEYFPVRLQWEKIMPMTNSLFQLTFPDDGWKETTVFTFEGPHDGGVQHNLVLTIDRNVPADVALRDYAKGQFEATAQVLPGFEFIEEKEKRMPSGDPVYEITYKYIPADEVILFQKQWYLFMNKKAFIFTSTFSKKTMNTIAHDVMGIIGSLKVGREEE